MNPFHFGSSSSPLFGILHPPLRDKGLNHGVLLCSPIGQEQMRSHRALRQLAQGLTRIGYSVLRFDYFGTGDSSGNCTEVRTNLCIENINTALEELIEMTGCDTVSIVGLRLGASFALQACSLQDKVNRLILWDPIITGSNYIDELKQADAAVESHVDHSNDTNQEGSTFGALGFPLTSKLHGDLQSIDLTKLRNINAKKISIVVSSQKEEFITLKNHLSKIHPNIEYQVIPSPGDWCEVDYFGSVLIPQGIIQGIGSIMANQSIQ